MKELLKAARMEEPADLLLAGGRVANLYTLEYENANVAIKGGIIIGIGQGYEARETVDCTGLTLAPSFVEGHMHVESTSMTPRNLAAAVAPHGTATIMGDPHEIANTCGMEGVRFMQRESRGLPVDIFYGAPSGVPASEMETPFAPLTSADIKTLFDEGVCTHLGEMMNFPGVFLGDDEAWAKLEAAKGRVITGHAPGLRGALLNSYIMGGVTSDHECASIDEAMEKLRRGMFIMIRQGATARNQKTLAPIVANDERLAARCMLVSDDITPEFMHKRGHLDGCLREIIAEGVSPLAALRMASLTPAEYFRLDDRGAIAPGKIADIVALESVEECTVKKVWKRGVLTAEDGKLIKPITPYVVSELPGYRGHVRTPTPDELRVPVPREGAMLNAIGVIQNQVATKTLVIAPTIVDGFAVADASRDIAKMAVVEKNRGTGRVGIGFLKNFGLQRGAVGSSVAHDAHNFTCAGMDDVSMAAAFAALAESKGGLVLTLGEKVLARLALPVGGLMSLLSADELREAMIPLMAARGELGCSDGKVFMHLAFLSLSVIPELKLTDQGYFDISQFKRLPLWAE